VLKFALWNPRWKGLSWGCLPCDVAFCKHHLAACYYTRVSGAVAGVFYDRWELGSWPGGTAISRVHRGSALSTLSFAVGLRRLRSLGPRRIRRQGKSEPRRLANNSCQLSSIGSERKTLAAADVWFRRRYQSISVAASRLQLAGKQQTSIMSLLLSISGDKSMIGQIFNAKCRLPPFLCAALYCCC